MLAQIVNDDDDHDDGDDDDGDGDDADDDDDRHDDDCDGVWWCVDVVLRYEM